ncbi:leader peptidase (prepilin peptidase) / N-methyltransferase [Streptococcus equinus]|uniref:Leader peptidase (Prepilin peptidase) / N-methyltransferase n=1 Tax=Streptococcus equinus TaxID=1335 RepID=A0A1H0LRZ9_STREI|nr:A24 family peptidase [Streptococcus equinus]SDO70756.1 leader peptidase (prepilin peptidase) / N-methyltransferase [Streptococcus equinus]
MDTLLFFFLGASLASFIGLVVDRFPEESILFPASHCETCGKKLEVRDLIPVFSQIINRSRCHFCKAKIPLWYGLFEFVCGLATAFCYHGIISPATLFIFFFSLTLSLYDFNHQSFPLLIWLIPSSLLLFFLPINKLTIILLLLGIIAELFDIKMGSGDFFYLATLSLFFDLQDILWIIEFGSLTGILFCLLHKNKRIPFVPFLFFGYLLVSFFKCT